MYKKWLTVAVYGNFQKRFEEKRWKKPPFFNFKYDPVETYDCTVFGYLKAVFDASDNIKMTGMVKEPRGTKGDCFYSYDYITKNGIEFTIDLFDTFPIPEASSYNFICNEFSEELLEEFRIAFSQYYRTEFKYCVKDGSTLRLYETEDDKRRTEEELGEVRKMIKDYFSDTK